MVSDWIGMIKISQEAFRTGLLFTVMLIGASLLLRAVF